MPTIVGAISIEIVNAIMESFWAVFVSDKSSFKTLPISGRTLSHTLVIALFRRNGEKHILHDLDLERTT